MARKLAATTFGRNTNSEMNNKKTGGSGNASSRFHLCQYNGRQPFDLISLSMVLPFFQYSLP